MSIVTDARLRLLEARVAEIERRLGERTQLPDAARLDEPSAPPAAAPAPRTKSSQTRKRSRKTP